MRKLWRNQSGLTIVEVSVAMVLLAVGILTSLTMLTGGAAVNDLNKGRNLALTLAQERIEYWKHRDEPVLQTLGIGESKKIEEEEYVRENVKYRVLVTAQRYEQTGDGDFVTVTVEVSWSAGARSGNTGQPGSANTKVKLYTIRPVKV